jgi:uncharacterized protein (DUF1810 family)
MHETHDLERFVQAQERTYEVAVAELRRGRKASHWMWFVFPQIAGLGRSPTAQQFAIRSLDEARAYLRHPILGPRLREASVILADELPREPGITAESVMGSIDAVKLRSSMTLFSLVGRLRGGVPACARPLLRWGARHGHSRPRLTAAFSPPGRFPMRTAG